MDVCPLVRKRRKVSAACGSMQSSTGWPPDRSCPARTREAFRPAATPGPPSSSPATRSKRHLVERAVHVSWQLQRVDRTRPLGWPPRPRPPAPPGRRPGRRGPRAGPPPLLGPAWARCRSTPTWATDRQAVRPLLLVRRDRRPQRAGPGRQPAREHGDRLRLAAGPLGRAAPAAGGRAGPGSRRSGSGRSGCWAGSRWTRRRTTGS